MAVWLCGCAVAGCIVRLVWYLGTGGESNYFDVNVSLGRFEVGYKDVVFKYGICTGIPSLFYTKCLKIRLLDRARS